MEDLLAKLSEQQALLEKQKNALIPTDITASYTDHDESNSDSVPLTPATDSFNDTPATEDSDGEKTIKLDPAEMLRLKKELDAAKNKIARQEQELSQTRIIKHTFDQAKGPSIASITAPKSETLDRTFSNAHDAYIGSTRAHGLRQESYGPHDDARSDISDAISAGAFNRAQNIWSSASGPGYNVGLPNLVNQQFQPPGNIWGQGNRSWMNRPMAPAAAPLMMSQQQQAQQRTFSGPTSPVSAGPGRFGNDFNNFQGGQNLRRSNTQNSRTGSGFPHMRNNGWDTNVGNTDSYAMSMTPISPFQPMGMFQAPMTYQPRPIGTPLSPTAAEFTTSNAIAGPWNSAVCHLHGNTVFY